MTLDEQLDRLYGLPLAEFTAARNELARELRGAGEREAADEVKALAKPSLSAWAVNQLARRERLQIRSLVTASEHVRSAQAELVGGGSPDDLREAVRRQRDVVDALVGSAGSLLRSAGHPATDATLERVRETLTAVAGDEEGRRLVERGRLTADLDPAGFGPVALGSRPTAKPHPRPRPAPKPDPAKRRRIEKAEREVERLRAEAAERRESLRAAKDDAAQAERAAKAAARAADREQAALDRLLERLATAEDFLERARSG